MERVGAPGPPAAAASTQGTSGGSIACNSGASGGAQPAGGPFLSPEPWSLFAFPAESNFSGARYDPALGRAAASLQLPPGARGGGPPGQWAVLLDAAKACGSCPPDLAAHPHIDFVVRLGLQGFWPLSPKVPCLAPCLVRFHFRAAASENAMGRRH